MLTREQFQVVYEQGPEALYVLFAKMHSTVETLEARVKELEDRLGKDSHNSSKPPSSDGLRKKPSPKSLRGKSGRRSGGQPGHSGHTLEFAEDPDNVVPLRPCKCQYCETSLENAAVVSIERHQVLDLPPLNLVVTEYQAYTVCCPDCKHLTKGLFPQGAQHRIQYGANIKALATYLMHFQLLPSDRLCELMSDMFGATFSEGTLQSTTRQAYAALEDVEIQIFKALCKADIINNDETGIRIGKKIRWLHVACTPWLTHYAMDPKRGSDAMCIIGILPQFSGRSIHDGLLGYKEFSCRHGLCNAHHLRELTAVEEQQHQPWAKQMRELLCEIKHAVDNARTRGEPTLHSLEVTGFEERYEAVLKIGLAANPPPERTGKKGRLTQGPSRNLLRRLDQDRIAVLAFMRDFTVPFDNNLAERDLRMMKVKQKISGCFRTDEGAKAYCRIRGYISTLRKQRYNLMPVLRQLFDGTPIMPSMVSE